MPTGALRWGLLITAVAAVGVIVVGVLAVVTDERAPRVVAPGVASAAAIKAEVRTSLSRLQRMSGVLVEDGPQRRDVRRWRFALTANGDLRRAGPGEGELITFDSADGVVRSAQRSASLGGGPLFYAERAVSRPGCPTRAARR